MTEEIKETKDETRLCRDCAKVLEVKGKEGDKDSEIVGG